ncbi:MAG: Ferredoxin subunit of nitrite reductase and ring-hydroxylating dioxygenase-like protein [Pseudonocardia sp.]|jgi:Rieske Fe-S protein|nr:Ferredoxin subunit of nitrite reductase and ring-hydroxylating dioxygenase-like protein [Pseudonocardia sp.]
MTYIAAAPTVIETCTSTDLDNATLSSVPGAAMSSDIEPDATRRALVTGICGAACAVCAAALTACGNGSGSTAPPAASPTPGAPAAPTAPGGTAPALTPTSDIPVGGGRIFPEYQIVVTRPAAGDLRAFTAICTHDGCMLTTVAHATIDCPCHGSRFAITDGAVVNGPAMRALTPRKIRVQGDSIILNP